MSNDPINVIMDHVTSWKYEGLKVFNKTVESVNDVITKSKPMISTAPPPPPPSSLLERGTHWLHRNKWVVGGITLVAVGAATTGYYYSTRKKPHRRAKRTSHGARKQVVLIAGSPNEAICRVVADDLDKRGFIVYITTSSEDEESMVISENSQDIRPLPIKAQKFDQFSKNLDEILNTPVNVFEDVPAHQLELAGVLVLPDLHYPTGPIETIRAETWSDLVSSKILGPVYLLSNGLLDVIRQHQSRVIIMSPNIMGSLNPAFHAPESITANALSSLALCLHRELDPLNVPVVHFKLGSFDVRPGRQNAANSKKQILNGMRADVLSWPDNHRGLYAQSYQASAHLQSARTSGSSLRTLTHAVVDSLQSPNPQRVVYVGKGSYAYRWLSGVVSEGIMTWLLQPSSAYKHEYDNE